MQHLSLPKIALGLEYPIALRGGVSVLVEALAEGLAGDYQIFLFSPDTAAQIQESAVAKWIAGHLTWNSHTASRKTSQILAGTLREQGVSLAHFHSGGVYNWNSRWLGQSPMPWCHREGIACVETAHQVETSILRGYCGPQKPLWFKLGMLPIAWLGKLHILSHLHTEIAVSMHDSERLRHWFWPLRNRIRCIYHSRLNEETCATASRDNVILSVGHIAMRKGQHLAVEAFAKIAQRHPGWKLLLAGPVAEEICYDRIQTLIQAHGLKDRVILLGSRDDALALMRRAAVYVQASTLEALGLALQEALYCGCACIGSRVGGIPELIEPERTGILFESGNVEELAAGFERLITEKSLREKFSEQGPQSILKKGMTQKQMIAIHRDLYDAILTKQGK